MNIKVDSIKDKYTLKHWLELAASNSNATTSSDFEEIDSAIKRLDREIAYYENFNSDEYKAYKKEREEPGKSTSWTFSEEDIKRIVDRQAKEKEERLAESRALLLKDHSEAVKWIVDTDSLINNESVVYDSDDDFKGIDKNKLKDLLSLFTRYIDNLAENIDSHELSNDGIDEWYFQRKDTENRFDKEGSYFPTETFVFDYCGYKWAYSITFGQGSFYTLKALNRNEYVKIANDYGLTLSQLDKKIYKI